MDGLAFIDGTWLCRLVCCSWEISSLQASIVTLDLDLCLVLRPGTLPIKGAIDQRSHELASPPRPSFSVVAAEARHTAARRSSDAQPARPWPALLAFAASTERQWRAPLARSLRRRPAPRDRRRPPPRRPRRRPCGAPSLRRRPGRRPFGAPSLRYPQQPSSQGRSGRGLVHDESMEGAASPELPVVALTATSKHGRGRCPYGQPGRPSAMADVGPGQASSTRRHGFGDSLFSF